MNPIRVWAVTAANSGIGLFIRLRDARDDARDLREHWGEKPQIVRGSFVPDAPLKPRRTPRAVTKGES